MTDDRQELQKRWTAGSPDRATVTIGVPVYNGGADLEQALQSLVEQDYPHIEILLSDNASTDAATSATCRRFAEQHAHVRYVQHPENKGAAGNFVWVAEQATGDYFLWAAHDDEWSPNYVSALVDALNTSPQAVLATPLTVYRKLKGDRATIEEIPPLVPGSRLERARQFLTHDRCVWIYGMFRTDWLRDHVGRLASYPSVTADLLWLFEMLLHEDVTGTANATYYRTTRARRDPMRSTKSRILLWNWIREQMQASVLQSAEPEERAELSDLVEQFYFRSHISRGNWIGTTVRLVKVATLYRWYTWFDPADDVHSGSGSQLFRSSYDAPTPPAARRAA